MRHRTVQAMLATAVLVTAASPATAQTPAEPPFGGTIFIDPDIITAQDATTFKKIAYVGRGKVQAFDRRRNRFITMTAYRYKATYGDGSTIEAQVNPEFGSRAKALTQARKYATVTGRLPRFFRTGVEKLWIHKGKQLFGGGSSALTIHTGQSADYERDGILEETLAHEAAHASLDGTISGATGWLAAQRKDPAFISTYAQDNPDREDVAESVVPWFAVRHRRDRIDEETARLIEATIPNRLRYFDQRRLKL